MSEEYWLSGPVQGVPSLLQPVAHALLQARDEIKDAVAAFDHSRLWDRPMELASVGFHLQHIRGVLDRLFTYAKGELLSDEQKKYLSEEGLANESINADDLLQALSVQVDESIGYLSTLDDKIVAEARTVGRKKLPSTVLGLLFHAAEHTMRHTGQLRVTARVVSQ